MDEKLNHYFKWIVSAVVLAVVLILLFLSITGELQMGDSIEAFIYNYGLAGLFVAAILSNASLFMVVPLDLLVLGLGEFYSPLLLGLVLGIGAALGELSAYVVGLGGRQAMKRLSSESAEKLKEMSANLKDYGLLFVILGAFTPFPFDLIGIAAGLSRYDIYRFFVGAFIGKFLRYFAIAYAGILGLQFIKAFFGLP